MLSPQVWDLGWVPSASCKWVYGSKKEEGVFLMKSWKYADHVYITTRKTFIRKKWYAGCCIFSSIISYCDVPGVLQRPFSLITVPQDPSYQVLWRLPAISSFCLSLVWKPVVINCVIIVVGAWLYNHLPHFCWPPSKRHRWPNCTK